jgi:hypothetical protein
MMNHPSNLHQSAERRARARGRTGQPTARVRPLAFWLVVGMLATGAVASVAAPPFAAQGVGPPASRTGGEGVALRGPVDVTAERLRGLFRQPPRDVPDPDEEDPCDDNTTRDCEEEPRAAVPAAQVPSLVRGPAPAALPQTPAPVTSWKALDSGSGNARPPDPQIAVSTTHVVTTLTRWIAFYDKAGNQLQSTSSPTFFSPLGLDDGTNEGFAIYSDMRCLFDSYRKRFWVCALARSPYTSKDPQLPAEKKRALITVAVSKTEDPNQGWWMYWWDAVAHWGETNDSVYQPGDVADYTMIGIDPDLFHANNVVANNEPGVNHRYLRVSFADADAMAAGQPGSSVSGWQFWDLTNPDGSSANLVQPVVHHGSTGRSYYVSHQGGTNNLIVWALTFPLTANQQLSREAVPLEAWLGPVDAPQKGSTDKISMTNTGTDVLKAVFRWPYLFCCTTDARNWGGDSPRSSVRFVRISAAGFPNLPTDAASGFVSRTFGDKSAEDPPGSQIYYAWAAVEANKNGDAVLVYARSGTTIYPEARFSAYLLNENDIRPSRLLKAGEAAYSGGDSPLRWGDLAGASVDPKDETAIWITHQYARSSGNSNNYGLWVGKVFGRLYFDKYFKALALGSPEARAGDSVRYSGVIANGGDGRAPAGSVMVELAGARTLYRLGAFMIPALAAGGSTGFQQTLRLPVRLAPGDYRVRLSLPPSPATEYSAMNNTAEAMLRVRSR